MCNLSSHFFVGAEGHTKTGGRTSSQSLKSKRLVTPPTLFDSAKDKAVNSPPPKVSYTKIKACQEDEPKGEMSQCVALGRAKVEEGRKNWKGKRKITHVIRQTGEGSDKRRRGGKKLETEERHGQRPEAPGKICSQTHLFNVFAIFGSHGRREQRKHVAEALVFHFGSHINTLEPPH